jgi:Protein phosphatase 2C
MQRKLWWKRAQTASGTQDGRELDALYAAAAVNTVTAEVSGTPAVSVVHGPIAVPQIVVGDPSPDVEPTVVSAGFRMVPFRPDTIVDGWSTESMLVRGASLRGHFHRYNGAPRQDEFALHYLSDGRVVALVADGVSQAAQSHVGAGTVVRYAAQWLSTYSPSDTAETDWLAFVKSTAWALAEQAQALFGLAEPDPIRAEQEFATTLLCAVIEPAGVDQLRAYVVGVGDSEAWLLRDGEFVAILGGKSVGAGGISSSAVSGLPRVPTHVEPAVVEFGRAEVLLLGTDGIGDPLGDGSGGVGNLFRELLGNPAPPSLIEFAHAVDFSRETFDDDRTLVAVRPRTASKCAGSTL